MNSYYKGIFRIAVLCMKHLLSITITALIAITPLSTVSADSDDPPLFVKTTGVDTGNCQSATTPCRTIDYALGKVGKNGQIRVGDGSYELTNVADVIYLLSGSIDVRGSRTTGSKSTLVGVPLNSPPNSRQRASA